MKHLSKALQELFDSRRWTFIRGLPICSTHRAECRVGSVCRGLALMIAVAVAAKSDAESYVSVALAGV
jgi:hypothetical protein